MGKRKVKLDSDTSKTVAKDSDNEDKAEESSASVKRNQNLPKPAKKKSKTDTSTSSDEKKFPSVSLNDSAFGSTVNKDKKGNMKIACWNVNGIRAWLKKKGLDYLRTEDPDIFCVQETKCNKESIPSDLNVSGYHTYWLSGDKDGYSGVGLYSKIQPLDVSYGIGVKKHDNEGRVITAEYATFYLVTAYVPNSGRGLPRLSYRCEEWDVDFRKYLNDLNSKKPIVLCGDLNVAHNEIDLANPKTNKKNAGFTQEERDGFTKLLSEGYVDTFRYLYPSLTGAYTFWSSMGGARSKNVGWRLDYFVISQRLVNSLCDSLIRSDVYGSDHCPIVLLLNI